MLHNDYVGTTLYAYKHRPDKGYKLICDLFEKVDKVLMSNKEEYSKIYKFKYSNPSDKEILIYGKKLGLGIYGAILFQYYLDSI